MKYIFFGTAEFSVAILEKLLSEFYFPELVVCQPDKPTGRKQILTSPLIKEICQDHNLKIAQPEKVKNIAEQIKQIKPDLIITASYGQIIPQEVLDIPRLGAINVHTSLLPKYRGAAPIQAVILNDERKTGITIMMMDKEMDHGALIFQRPIKISATETGLSLYNKLAGLGAETLTKILPDFVKGKMKPQEQDHEQATFTKLIKKADSRIDWSKTAEDIERFVRAYYDWPIAWTILPNEKRLKIFSAELDQDVKLEVGQILMKDNQAYIGTTEDTIKLKEVQVEGNKITSGQDFARGYQQLNEQFCR